MPDESQLRQLAEPFPEKLIKELPASEKRPALSYVAWFDKLQRLLSILGAVDWTVCQVGKISGDDDEPMWVVGTISATVDGERVSVDGIGQGKDAKNAESDALSRAATKLACGVHLATKGTYWLPAQLDKEADEPSDE